MQSWRVSLSYRLPPIRANGHHGSRCELGPTRMRGDEQMPCSKLEKPLTPLIFRLKLSVIVIVSLPLAALRWIPCQVIEQPKSDLAFQFSHF